MNPYRYRPKPVEVEGVWYASQMEGRLARLLIKNGIPFTPHKLFNLFDRSGRPFVHAVDFYIHVPIKPIGTGVFVQALEIKGALSTRDLLRCDALKYCVGVRCYIVTEALLGLWEREQMFEVMHGENH